MPRRRGRSHGRVGRTRRWTADQSTALAAVVSPNLGFLTVVVPGDYEQSATMEQGGVTLLRLRGNLNCVNSVANADVALGIWVGDEGLAPVFGANFDPFLFSQLIRGELLYHRRLIVGTTPVNIEVDVKAKRKLSDSSIHMVLGTLGPGTLTVSASGRALLLGG